MTVRSLLNAALLAGLLMLGVPAPAAPAAKPQTVALIATLGDQLTVQRQRGPRSSAVEATWRRSLSIDGQLLNDAVLRGLDSALALEEPASRRVMLRWRASETLSELLKRASPAQRDALLLEALRAQLLQMPQRAEWDRVEAVLPHFDAVEREGMPRRLAGIGIYVKPVGSLWLEDLDEDGIDKSKDFKAQEHATVNPSTGERATDSAYVAPYISFDRVTLDARTLAVLARKPHFASTKFSKPTSTAIDVLDDISPAELVAQLNTLVERAAYHSVRGQVEVGPVKQLPSASPPPR